MTDETITPPVEIIDGHAITRPPVEEITPIDPGNGSDPIDESPDGPRPDEGSQPPPTPADPDEAVDDGVITGTTGDDVITGGADSETISGRSGNDEIRAGSGDDVLKGGKGDDKLYGEGGDDVIKGGSGDDQLRGGGGMDTLSGNEGNDKYFHYGGWGNSTVDEQGGGTDTMRLGGLSSDKASGEAWELVVAGDELQFIYSDRQAANGNDRGVFIVDALTDSNGDGTLDEHDMNVIETFQFDDITVDLHELLEMTGNSGIIDEDGMLL